MSIFSRISRPIFNFYDKQPRIIKELIWLFPFVNWFFEFIFRWTWFGNHKKFIPFVVAVVATLPFGIILGWVDFCWRLLFKRMIFVRISRV